MAFWKLVKGLLAALIVFCLVNFFLSNSSPEANSLAAKVSFKFSLPPFQTFESMDFSVGYLLLISFTLGMILTALIIGLNAFSHAREMKNQKKTIRELEKENEVLRQNQALVLKKSSLPEAKLAEGLQRFNDQQPEVY